MHGEVHLSGCGGLKILQLEHEYFGWSMDTIKLYEKSGLAMPSIPPDNWYPEEFLPITK